VDEVTTFILAGGRSTRMGRDKAFLELGGRTLLERALEIGKAVGEVKIVGDPIKFSAWGAVIDDVYRERGPLGAIHAALAGSATEWNFMLAVDMPFVEPAFVLWLITEACKGAPVVTVPRAGGGLQPLCGVYRRGFAEIARRSLEAGKNKIDPLFAELETRIIEEEELVKCGFSPAMFRNLNTPDEWEQVLGTEYRVKKPAN
jgi:molybdopterin-guanine dinucleotide biosynthesis protein A